MSGTPIEKISEMMGHSDVSITISYLKEFSNEDLVNLVIKQEEAGESRKEAIAQVAKVNGVSRRVVFDAMVAHKSGDKI